MLRRIIIMKKYGIWAAVILCAAAYVSLCGCGGGENSSGRAETTVADSQSEITGVPESRPDDSSSQELTDVSGESSMPDITDDSSLPAKPTTPLTVCKAFLESMSEGDKETALGYCSGDVSGDELEPGFKYELGDALGFVTSAGENITVVEAQYTPDGVVMSRDIYVLVTTVDGEAKVFSLEQDRFPASLLEYLGVDSKVLEEYKDKSDEKSDKNAKALLAMTDDVIADAEMNGVSVDDGEYTKNDGSMISKTINANLGDQGVVAADYKITVRDGKAVSAAIFDADGNQTEVCEAE